MEPLPTLATLAPYQMPRNDDKSKSSNCQLVAQENLSYPHHLKSITHIVKYHSCRSIAERNLDLNLRSQPPVKYLRVCREYPLVYSGSREREVRQSSYTSDRAYSQDESPDSILFQRHEGIGRASLRLETHI